MPFDAGLAPRSFRALSEFSAELVRSATDRFVRHLDATLKQQLLDVAQPQAESEIPMNRAIDDFGRKTVTLIKRFLHRVIVRDYLSNMTMPLRQILDLDALLEGTLPLMVPDSETRNLHRSGPSPR